MIEPKEIIIDGLKFIIHKFPALIGREIVSKYIPSIMSKTGDYEINKETLLKMMKFVGIVLENHTQPLMLITEALIDNHVKNWEILAKIEMAIMEYNCSFFQNGRLSNLFEDIAPKSPA
jgi:hypothetical protein